MKSNNSRMPSFTCVICRNEIEQEFGNNAWPVQEGKCCDLCNATKVIPARISLIKRNSHEVNE